MHFTLDGERYTIHALSEEGHTIAKRADNIALDLNLDLNSVITRNQGFQCAEREHDPRCTHAGYAW